MPQSIHQLYGHLIFSTKHRRPFLDEKICDRMHGYLASLCREAGCPWVVVGGVGDHVHIAMELGKALKSVDLIAKIKKRSSHWMKGQGEKYEDFYWQDGYGLFSFGPTQRDAVEAYVRTQEKHHQKQTFQEELLSFLNRYGYEYDERYLWD